MSRNENWFGMVTEVSRHLKGFENKYIHAVTNCGLIENEDDIENFSISDENFMYCDKTDKLYQLFGCEEYEEGVNKLFTIESLKAQVAENVGRVDETVMVFCASFCNDDGSPSLHDVLLESINGE